jgi:hypothetical protein
VAHPVGAGLKPALAFGSSDAIHRIVGIIDRVAGRPAGRHGFCTTVRMNSVGARFKRALPIDRAKKPGGFQTRPYTRSRAARNYPRSENILARRINEMRHSPGAPVWQRNYYEHVVGNDGELLRIREYILNNPLDWENDRENPARPMDLKSGRTIESWHL